MEDPVSEIEKTYAYGWDLLTPPVVECELMSLEDVDWWTLKSDDHDECAWGEDLGPVKLLESIGGDEGSGEYMAVVLQVGSRVFRKEGHYASWDNDRWDGKFREVKPVKKMITVWEEQ